MAFMAPFVASFDTRLRRNTYEFFYFSTAGARPIPTTLYGGLFYAVRAIGNMVRPSWVMTSEGRTVGHSLDGRTILVAWSHGFRFAGGLTVNIHSCPCRMRPFCRGGEAFEPAIPYTRAVEAWIR